MLDGDSHHQENFGKWPTKLACLIGVARAVRLLHSEHLVHSDIKCENILVQHIERNTYTAILADFGSICEDQCLRRPVGTVRYMAPELLDSLDSDCQVMTTLKVDIFAFAFVGWVLVSDEEKFCPTAQKQVRMFQTNPWPHGNNDHAVKVDIRNEKRPAWRGMRNSAWSNFYGLIEMCWSQLPDDRPDFDIIQEILEGLAAGCFSGAVRGSKGPGSPEQSAASTEKYSLQNLCRNPSDSELGVTLNQTVNSLKDKNFGCRWPEHIIKDVEWTTDQKLNKSKIRKLNMLEKATFCDADKKLYAEVRRHVILSGTGQNCDVYEGETAMWTLEGITALRASQRCVQ